MNVMKNWKNEIRNSIMRVRNEFVEWVDTFTQSTIKSLKGIESQSRELSDLGVFMIDANLRRMLEELRESFVKIMVALLELPNFENCTLCCKVLAARLCLFFFGVLKTML